MKIYKVLYYSYTGNSEFIAKKIAAELNCRTQQIIPAVNNVFILFLLSLLKLGIPVKLRQDNISEADEVILIGPIWGGQMIAPLRTAINGFGGPGKAVQTISEHLRLYQKPRVLPKYIA